MDSFQQIGIAIIFGFIIYLVYFYYNKYNRQKENFEVKGGIKTKEILEKIKTTNASLTDILLVSKYRTDYESIIENTKKYVGINMIELLLQIDPTASITDETIKTCNNINTLYTMHNNLENILTKHLDLTN